MVVYYFENVSYVYKGWDAVFKEIVEYLKKEYNAEVIYKSNNPTKEGSLFYIEEFDHYMADCELLIYDKEKDILKGLSFSEYTPGIWNIFIKRNNKNDLFLITQLYDWFNKDIYTGKDKVDFSKWNFKIGSTVFYTLNQDIDYDNIYNLRNKKQYSSLEDKLFMLFNTQRADPYKLSELGYLNKSLKPLNNSEYFEMMIGYKVGLAIATVAEYCYRDIEYMAVGVPFMRLPYLRHLDPPLVENYHYIAIDRDKYKLPYNTGLNRQGGENYVKAYIDRFLEVKEDYDFLNYISKNARDYYEKYIHPNNRLRHNLNLLNIK